MKSLFATHMNLTEKVLDLRLQRQNLVASNIANIDTPGYRERRIEFETELQDALELGRRGRMAKTSPGHIPNTFDPDKCEGTFHKDTADQIVQGKDSVDLDKEMSVMAKNTLLYNAMATTLKKGFEGLRTTIQEASK
ncbi:flagellar basal body rod protein FlgB [Desulfoplanes sp.]